MFQRITAHAFAICLFTLALASAAQAQATRTWVSGVGDDANPCSRTAPCKTFAGAISKTAVNGEINVIDPGGFGAVAITKSITIDGYGSHASALSSGTNGFVVNIAAGNANDPHRSVRLRNLSINGSGAGARTGFDGIRFLAGTTLFVEHVAINDFSSDGIEVAGSAAEANAMSVILNDVEIRNCDDAGFKAAHASASGQVFAMLTEVRIHACAVGVDGVNRTRLTLVRGVVTHHQTALRQTGANNYMNLDAVFVSNSGVGIQSSAGNTVRVSNSFITQNTTGLNVNGGAITSLSGNTLTGNNTNGSFTGTTVPKS